MDPHSPEMTVGDILDLLSACDRDTPVRLAINPFFPMAHRLGGVEKAVDEHGRPMVYIAESPEAEQFGPLPPAVAVALTWQDPVEAPPRRRRGATGPDAGQ
ncbi:hypothetical protein QFZ63_001941 [Streptomyces sp. B3I7]|nr:hypothetical protein OV320_8277 [Actinobacteria bacterium OV320]MDQ0810227.1 hypothetical protein [Streptomyces sp. B3I7]MDQ0834491.1 hypothetical protein [Streptomyces achromogenes]MDQ0957924.1 hypothetical protein [Streptomyces sp. B4I13]